MMKKIRQNSLKNKIPYNEPKTPEHYKNFAEKKSLQLCGDIPTPKKGFPFNLYGKNGFSTTTNENSSKIIPQFPNKDKHIEKSIESKQKIMSQLSKINITNKKSLSESKDKENISNCINTSNIVSNETRSKNKVNLHVLEDYEKNNYQSENFKTPFKILKTNFSSNIITPKSVGTTVSTRNPFAVGETDQSKVLNILNGNNNIPISINNLKLFSNQNYQTAKFSSKSLSYVRGYSANTNQGIIR